MSRQWTPDEVREKFLAHLENVAEHWATTKLPPQLVANAGGSEARARCRGVVFSALVMLDGGAGDMPAFRVFPCTDPSGPEFHRQEGTNFYPVNKNDVPLLCEITRESLHEAFATREAMAKLEANPS
jgi:hypothetical protein